MKLLIYPILFIVICLTTRLYAQIRDSSFASDGIYTASLGSGRTAAFSSLIQKGDRLLLGGYSLHQISNIYPESSVYQEFWMTRLMPDGSKDSSFGFQGEVLVRAGSDTDVIHSLAEDAQGRILAGGNSGDHVIVLRYSADGKLDPTFGIDGRSPKNLFQKQAFLRQIKVAKDQSIYALAASSIGINFGKFFPNGRIDTSYHSFNSWVIFPPLVKEANNFTLQYDSLPVITGSASGAGYLVRLKTNGIPDSTFAKNGILKTDSLGMSAAQRIHALPNGKLLVAGLTSTFRVIIAKLLPDGRTDTAFGQGGITPPLPFAGNTSIKRLEILPSGDFFVSGTSRWETFTVRYLSTGIPDSSFGWQGIVNFSIENLSTTNYALHPLPDGRIYHVGDVRTRTAVSRIMPEGSFDPTYKGLGYQFISSTNGGSEILKITTDKQNNMWVGGKIGIANSTGSIDYKALLAPLDPNGNPKKLITYPTIETIRESSVYDVFMYDDSTVLTTGITDQKIFFLRKYDTQGNPDIAFNQATANLLGQVHSFSFGNFLRLGKLSNGNIILGCSMTSTCLLANMDITGKMDNTFGQSGLFYAPWLVQGGEYPWGLHVYPNDDILLGSNSNYDFLLAKVNANGILDSNFGRGGYVTTDIGSFTHDVLFAIEVLPNGKILAAGRSGNVFTLVRYEANGSLDQSFGTNGIITTFFLRGNAKPFDMEVLHDGRILLAGTLEDAQSGNKDAAIACYMPDGSPCSGFGTNGQLVLDYNGQEDIVYSIHQQADGKILLGGSTDGNMLVIRLLNNLQLSFSEDFQPKSSPQVLVYPNPIHSTSLLQYELKKNQEVIISLLDVQGRLVQRIWQGEGRVGQNEQLLKFSPALAPGFYVLQVQAGEANAFIKIQKMVQ